MSHLSSIVIQDFRNYERLELEPVPGVNLLVGLNGQGKTNLLEAIHYLSLLRSFRTTQLRTLVRWGQSTFQLRARIDGESRGCRLAIEHGQQRRLLVDRQPVQLASEFIGHFFCVTFVPEDIALVKGTASDRRRYLDILGSQLVPHYLAALQDYGKALKSRNALLRAERPDPRQVSSFDRVLADRGSFILMRRRELVGRLDEALVQVGDAMSRARELTMEYAASVELPADADESAAAESYRLALNESLERDLARRQTHRGPHRDDLRFRLRERLLGDYGSEGQCRLAALALKMAAGNLFMQRRQDDAVIWLVDDVVGELDAEARGAFFACLEQADQAFLVATDDHLAAELPVKAIYDVAGGRVTAR